MLILVAAPLLMVTGGCTPGQDGGDRIAADAPPDSASHELRNVFRVSRLTDSVSITRVTDIQFLSGGNLVIDHAETSRRLLELDPAGQLIRQIGGAGRGEGQFTEISRFVVTPDDSLHVYDDRLTRRQVFARDASGWWHVRTSDAERNLSDLFIADHPLSVYPAPGVGYRTLFENEFFYSDTTHRFYRFLSETGYGLNYTGSRQLMRPVQDAVVTRTGQDLKVDWSARFRAAWYCYRPATGEVLYISNTSPDIRLLDWDGGERVTGRLPHEKVPMNRQAVQGYLDRVSGSYPEERMDRIRSRYLEHEPLFRHIFLDGDRIWVRLTRSDAGAPQWMVTDLGGTVLAAFRQPPDFEAMAVRNGRLYGIQRVDEEPHLAAFELEPAAPGVFAQR